MQECKHLKAAQMTRRTLKQTFRTLALAWLLALAASHGFAQNILPEKWQSQHFANNPLVGQIFKGDGEKTTAASLALAARLYRYVLLGEQHDNPDHHRIQANLIAAVVADKRRPSVVLEMVPRSYADKIARYNLRTDPQLKAFAKSLDWEKRGWYSWEIYKPIALAAAKSLLAMVAGNLDNDVTRAISKQGFDALTPDQRKSFGLNGSFGDPNEQSLLNELKGSHCGMMPETALPSMLNVQRAKDGSMADAMVRSGLEVGSILIAGNGHVRKDRGVPNALRTLLPGLTERKVTETLTIRIPNANSLSIGLIEVAKNQTTFADYGLANEAGKPLYDFVLFTPKFDITDHCAALRKKFAPKSKEKKKSP